MAAIEGSALLSRFYYVMFERLAAHEVEIFLRPKEDIRKLLKKLENLYELVKMRHNKLKDVDNKTNELGRKIEATALFLKKEGHQSAMFCSNMFNDNVKYELEEILSSLERFLSPKDALGLEPVKTRASVMFERLAAQEVQIFLRPKEDIRKLLKKLEDLYELVEMQHNKLNDVVNKAIELGSQIKAKALFLKKEGHQSAMFCSNPFNDNVKYELEEILSSLERFLSPKDALGLEPVKTRDSERFSPTPVADESGFYGREDIKETEGYSSTSRKDALSVEPVKIRDSERFSPTPVADESGFYGREDIKETEGYSSTSLKDALSVEPVKTRDSERFSPTPVADESGFYGREDIKETEGYSSTITVGLASTKQPLRSLAPPCRRIWLAWSVKHRVNKLKEDISAIKAFLPDAEEKQFDDPKIKNWLEGHQNFMIDADKVLEEFECQQLRRQVQKMYGGKRRKVLRSIPIAFRLSIGRKIRKLSRLLDEIAKVKDEFQLVERHEETGMRKQKRTCADVVGRDSDKEKIIYLLLGENEDTPKVHVVSIVGEGGMGKTTVARLVYNDKRVENHFELKMWVCNSDNDFNVERLLKEILDSATGTKNDGFTYDQLHTQLRGLLKNKRFLLILDEMQNEDPLEWSELNKFLVGGSNGSRILVTTRSQKVAEIMRSNKSIHTLQGLSEEHCETLFLRYSFDQGMLEEPKKLGDFGKQLVERCEGVPLAVKTLASLLYSKPEDEWERIRDHLLRSIKHNEENVILPVLRLGYNYLPAHLKPCFVYSSVFPKGCRFSFKEVLDVWMARGLLRSVDDEDKSFEQVCKEYVEQLIFRSLVEQEGEYTYYLHDLFHDLALDLSKNKCSVITSPTQVDTAISCDAVVLCKASEESVRNVLSKRNVSKFKYLWMLDLGGSSFEMLPGCIGKLRHLKSLNLCANQSLKRLPNSIWKLQSLGILRLDGCKELEGLPKDIRKMISLKILTLTTWATYLPDKGIECLMSLQSLEIRDCKNLTALPSGMFGRLTALERLEIHDCPRLDISQQNAENHLNKLRHLTIDGLRKMMTLPDFLKESRGTLCRLKISRCPVKALPEWMADMISVESISIEFCPNLNSLPEGMTSFISSQKLKIKGCPGL